MGATVRWTNKVQDVSFSKFSLVERYYFKGLVLFQFAHFYFHFGLQWSSPNINNDPKTLNKVIFSRLFTVSTQKNYSFFGFLTKLLL